MKLIALLTLVAKIQKECKFFNEYLKNKEVPYVLIEILPRYSNYKKVGIQWFDISLLL